MTMITWNNTLPWKDTGGAPLHAHGGGIVRAGDTYYWFGENRQGRNRVSCYSSANLADWELRSQVLTLDSEFSPLDFQTYRNLATEVGGAMYDCNIERPKVLYNSLTGKYVMWMHWENGHDYLDARCAVASCDTVDGDYTYHGSFNPIGHMSRDCTLFQDDDGTAYFISAARDNADLHIYRLTEDYLGIDMHIRTLWASYFREAPALFKREGYYYMITSGCTGWPPNQALYATAVSLTGTWSVLKPLGSPTTYDTQPAFVLPVHGTEAISYLYYGDRWDPSDYQNSSYVVLPLTFPKEAALELNWADEVCFNPVTGHALGKNQTASEQFRIKGHGMDTYLGPVEGADIGPDGAPYKDSGPTPPFAAAESLSWLSFRRLSYADLSLHWRAEPNDGEEFVIRHVQSGSPLSVADAEVKPSESGSNEPATWSSLDIGGGWCKLIHTVTGQALTMTINGLALSPLVPCDQSSWGSGSRYEQPDRQAWYLAPVYNK